jgi:hypothetical protein
MFSNYLFGPLLTVYFWKIIFPQCVKNDPFPPLFPPDIVIKLIQTFYDYPCGLCVCVGGGGGEGVT